MDMCMLVHIPRCEYACVCVWIIHTYVRGRHGEAHRSLFRSGLATTTFCLVDSLHSPPRGSPLSPTQSPSDPTQDPKLHHLPVRSRLLRRPVTIRRCQGIHDNREALFQRSSSLVSARIGGNILHPRVVCLSSATDCSLRRREKITPFKGLQLP